MRDENQFTKRKQAQPKNFVGFPSGIGGVGLRATFGAHSMARVEVYFSRDTRWNKALSDRSFEWKEYIQAKLGFELNWERIDGKHSYRILIVREGSIDDDDEALEDLRD